MLARHMMGYAPSLIVTAFLSFVSVTLFTSLMTQAEYGQYALTISTMTMLVGVGFFWLQSSSSRLLPQAVVAGQQDKFIATLYSIFLMFALVMILANIIIGAVVTAGDWYVALWCAVPMAILRALLTLNQAVHRTFVRIGQYNILEIGQGIIGFTVAMIFVVCFHYAAMGAALGTMIGLLVMLAIDWSALAGIKLRDFDAHKFGEIAHFGAPFVITYGLGFILSGSDRFLIEYFLGPDQVGIYSAGYAFPDRIVQNLFMAVSTAAYPLVVRKFEQEGVEAARRQTYANGVAILALAMPACIGLLIVNHLIAATLIGVDFRAGAVQIMPIIAVATILSGLATHYFDYAFYLAKKARWFFFTMGPAALLNFIGNLYVIPRFGIIGAAYTTLAAYALCLLLSIMLGRRVFRVSFPFKPALKIAIATGVMAMVLLSFSVPENAAGLIVKISVGAIVYAACLFTFNVMGIRTRFLARRDINADRGDIYHYEIIAGDQAATLAPEWRALHQRAGSPLFGTYDLFQIWQRHLSASEKTEPQIIIARSSVGELKALLALATRNNKMVALLEWAGASIFDYCDILAETDKDAQALWGYACSNAPYDIALIKDVRTASASYPILQSAMQLREIRKNYYVALDGLSGDVWLAAQSRKLRGDTRRKMEN